MMIPPLSLFEETFVLEAPVNYDLEWAEALRRGAPNTPRNCSIWNVSDQFPTSKKGVVTEKLTVVRFEFIHRFHRALCYARDNRKSHAHPRALWAIGERHSELASEFARYEQGENQMFLKTVSTCMVNGEVVAPFLCCVRNGYREAGVYWTKHEFDGCDWFVFGE